MSALPDAMGSGLGPDGLEVLFPALAEHLDATAPGQRERFLAKAFLLLAEIHGDADAAIRALRESAATAVVAGRGTA